MKRTLFVFFVSLSLLGCNAASKAQDMYLGLDTTRIGVVLGNTVKYYYFDDGWIEIQGREFILE
jgi:hypothetical protein